jgi:hypothetical protein
MYKRTYVSKGENSEGNQELCERLMLLDVKTSRGSSSNQYMEALVQGETHIATDQCSELDLHVCG